MKRSTAGLKVRFFNVTIAHGHAGIGNSTGNTFNIERSTSKRTVDLGNVVMNWPEASIFSEYR
jgi:hypothetical protein